MKILIMYFGLGSMFILHISVYNLLRIAHPISVCVAMIGYLVIREQMIWQVGREMHRLGARASRGYFVYTYSICLWFCFENLM